MSSRSTRHLGCSALLAVLCSCYPAGWRGAAGVDDLGPFDVGPYLVRMSPRSIAVVAKADRSAEPWVEWWPAPAAAPGSVSSTVSAHRAAPEPVGPRRAVAKRVNELWVATLDDLPLGARFAYRMHSSKGSSRTYRAKAGVARGAPFRFAVIGDTRTGHQVHRELIDALARESIDFVVHSGDMVETGGLDHEWERFFQIEQPVIAHAPLFAALGNHDSSPRNHFDRWFLLSEWNRGQRYYVQDWGDLRVVVMNSEDECRSGCAQYAFLERALAEGAKNDMLMAIVLHYPPYSSGTHGSHDFYQEVVGELAPRFGVELVVAGHDHDYERTKPIDGVTYIVAASGGAPVRTVTPQAFSEVLRTEPHYVLFDVERGALVGRAVNLLGNAFDTFTIPPNPPRPVPAP